MRRKPPFGCPLETGVSRIQTGPKELYAIATSAISKGRGGLPRQHGWEPKGAHECFRQRGRSVGELFCPSVNQFTLPDRSASDSAAIKRLRRRHTVTSRGDNHGTYAKRLGVIR